MRGKGFLNSDRKFSEKRMKNPLTWADFGVILKVLPPGSGRAPCKLNNVRTKKAPEEDKSSLWGAEVLAERSGLKLTKRLLKIL